IALIKYKKLVGEGFLKIVNQTVPEALSKLGYSAEQVAAILKYIDEQETIEGAPGLKDEHLSVFDCAFKAKNGQRSIHYMGHVRMMAATQPFLSGAISKTVNMPEAATAEDIESVYLEGWKLGLKAIAIYRDGSKRSQPLNTSKKKDEPAASSNVLVGTGVTRRRLPVERTAITHRFDIAGQEGYLTVGLYEDGQPGEIFLKMAKEGSTVSGLVDTFATTVSVALQYGVPLRDLVNKFAHVRFEPSGFTGNAEIPIAKSIVDYVFRYLGSRFLPESDRAALGLQERADGGPLLGSLPSTVRVGAATDSCGPNCSCGKGGGTASATTSAPVELKAATPAKAAAPAASSAGQVLASAGLGFQNQSDAPSCPECGAIMVRNAACYKCMTCGTTSGCS
ncbi:MAG: vitamin B12-dependent ribonucleotide reductase, partial [Candidatus Limnocylindrus sp.]